MRGLITSAMVCLALLAGPVLAGPTAVRYWDWGRTPKRDDYQFAVLRMALDKGAGRYGAYDLTRVVADYSTLRSRQEVSEGTTVNVQAGPWRALSRDDPSDRRIAVNVPFMAGLLGYRFVLIRKEDQARFDAIRQASDLKAMMAGQGREWAELGLYRRNGYRVMDSGNINTLLAMLANRRFDYLPMSVTETSTVLNQHPELAGKLTVAPNLMISYPLPTIFYVSARHPELAERIEYGLKLASRDGSLDALLHQYFDSEIASMLAVTRHFSMRDPAVPRQLLSALPAPRK